MAKRNDDIGDWIEEEASGGGLSLIGWGFGTVAAFVLAFASWQYAPPRTAGTELARLETSPDPSDITGSIALADQGRTVVEPSRAAASRVAPLPLDGAETVATSRDIARLRAEIRDLQQRIAGIGPSDGGPSRLAAARTSAADGGHAPEAAPVAGGEAPLPTSDARPTPASDAKPPAEKTIVERLPVPTPRPLLDLTAALAPPSVGFDAEGPTTTGAVPKTAGAPKSEPTRSEPLAKSARGVVPAAPPPPKPAAGTKTEPEIEPKTEPKTETEPDAEDAAALPPIEPRPPVRIVSATPATAFAPPAPTPNPAAAEAPAAIDLGGFRSLASLRRSWADMSLRYGDLSKGMEPRARLRETDSGMEARLLAGPFTDPTSAAKACLRLRAAGAPCTVTTYGGQPISGLR